MGHISGKKTCLALNYEWPNRLFKVVDYATAYKIILVLAEIDEKDETYSKKVIEIEKELKEDELTNFILEQAISEMKKASKGWHAKNRANHKYMYDDNGTYYQHKNFKEEDVLKRPITENWQKEIVTYNDLDLPVNLRKIKDEIIKNQKAEIPIQQNENTNKIEKSKDINGINHLIFYLKLEPDYPFANDNIEIIYTDENEKNIPTESNLKTINEMYKNEDIEKFALEGNENKWKMKYMKYLENLQPIDKTLKG